MNFNSATASVNEEKQRYLSLVIQESNYENNAHDSISMRYFGLSM